MKLCSHCGQVKPVSEFNKGQYYCKDCQKEYSKEFYRKKKAIPAEAIITEDGNRLISTETPIEKFSSRELLVELKKRGYYWEKMYVKQEVFFDKI